MAVQAEKMSMTEQEWRAKGSALFGDNPQQWRFKCPSCGHVATPSDWKNFGAPEGAVAFSCVGRWAGSKQEIFTKKGGPCNYAGGGLFGLNPILVTSEDGTEYRVFDFEASSHV